MNKEEECDIVKDLAIPYTENLVNSKSKIFIERHLRTCDTCKKYYEAIGSDLLKEKQKEKKEENYELNFLKKIKKRMNSMKIVLMIIAIILITIVVGLFLKYYKLNEIIDNSYSKIEWMKTLDNYKLTQEETEINYSENTTTNYTMNYYYKNGKAKQDNGNTVSYYEDDSYEKIYVFHDLKQIDYYKQNIVEQRKGDIFSIFSEVISYKKELTGIYRLMLSERTEKYNGIDCYVIRMGNEKSYREVWIDKNTNYVIRKVEEEYQKYYRDTRYTLEIDAVSDEDVDSSILETDKYRDYQRNHIEYNAPGEIKEFYERVY